jgi:hypothetical protein
MKKGRKQKPQTRGGLGATTSRDRIASNSVVCRYDHTPATICFYVEICIFLNIIPGLFSTNQTIATVSQLPRGWFLLNPRTVPTSRDRGDSSRVV